MRSDRVSDEIGRKMAVVLLNHPQIDVTKIARHDHEGHAGHD